MSWTLNAMSVLRKKSFFLMQLNIILAFFINEIGSESQSASNAHLDQSFVFIHRNLQNQIQIPQQQISGKLKNVILMPKLSIPLVRTAPDTRWH